jgi:hypothetical protein
MADTRVLYHLGRSSCGGFAIRREHRDPNDADAYIRLWKTLNNRFIYRTGTLDTLWSRRRQYGHKARSVLVAVEVVLQRL